MKRLISLGAFLVIAATSMVLAQTTTSQAILRTASGDHQVRFLVQNGETYISATDVAAAMGGTLTPDATGFRVTINNAVAAFGPDSRFGVIRDDLIEMPTPPIVLEGNPYVAWQFFQGYLSKAADQEVSWDPAARILSVKPQQHAIIGVQFSVANVQGTSKVVITLSGQADYAIAKEPGSYTIRFKGPI